MSNLPADPYQQTQKISLSHRIYGLSLRIFLYYNHILKVYNGIKIIYGRVNNFNVSQKNLGRRTRKRLCIHYQFRLFKIPI